MEQCKTDLIQTFHSIYGSSWNETELDEIIDCVWKHYCKEHNIPKSCYLSFMFSVKKYMNSAGYESTDATVKTKLKELANLPQPVQRTPEWYEMRIQLLTATAISKLFFSDARTNSVIYEKCGGGSGFGGGGGGAFVSERDPRHWGQKYEPVTRTIYETIYNARIKEYGCIRHRQYPFIGASPDGINIYPHSSKYGRLVEIKNIVNREIICEPSEEYWIQMQIQMEVCDLDICDFVETRFKEWTEEEYFRHTQILVEEEPSTPSVEFHGIILQFIHKDNIHDIHYEYMPLFHTGVVPCMKKIEKWRNNVIKKCRETHLFVKTLYWYLDEISVVVVLRNRVWFSKALPEITRVWNTIETERISGFNHRKPKQG